MEKSNQELQVQASKHTFPPRMLTSGKLVGDPNALIVIKDNKIFNKDREENRNNSQESSNKNAKINTQNKFDILMNEDEGNMDENRKQGLENGEHQHTNIEVDNCLKPKTSTKQWIESTFKSPKGKTSLQWGIRVEEEKEAEEENYFKKFKKE